MFRRAAAHLILPLLSAALDRRHDAAQDPHFRIVSTYTNTTTYTLQEKWGRMAVFVVGTQKRLIAPSKIRQIVGEQLRHGWDVDFYLRLESPDAAAPNSNTKSMVPTSASSLTQRLKDSISLDGGTLVHCDLLGTKDDVESDFPNRDKVNISRLDKHSPYNDTESQDLLRRFKSMEVLVRLALRRAYYDFILVTNDDEHWLGTFKLRTFMEYTDYTNRVFFKNCFTHGGVNGGSMLFGRKAFHAVLPKIYQDFWLPSRTLETDTIERFLGEFMKIKGVTPTPVSFYDMPTAPSINMLDPERGPILCQPKSKLCMTNPNNHPKNRHGRGQQDVDEPVVCPSFGSKPADKNATGEPTDKNATGEEPELEEETK